MSSEEEVEEGYELYMHTYHTLPDECKKYWKKRYQLFSRYDEGIYMTSELWYSVTPEYVADFTANLLAQLMPKAHNVLDLCCGGGGNTIQLAKHFESVGAIDINPHNEQCTIHNAEVYGVEDYIWSYVGDWNDMCRPHEDGTIYQDWIPDVIQNKDVPSTIFDFIFASPPWGGPAYTRESFDLYTMEPFALDTFIPQLLQYTRNICLFLPKSLNLDQIREVTAKHFGPSAKCRVVYVKQGEYCIGILAFWGDQFADPTKRITVS